MKRRTFIGQVLPLVAAASQNSRGRRNVLFISVDDLRPTLGCYGAPLVRTPNIDALARTGMVFERAYCQQAVCTPSRSSLLTGRPDTIRVYDQPTYFRKNRPDIVTLPQCFKRNGYRAEAFGKVLAGQFDDPPSWSTEVWPVPIAGMEYVDTEALEKMRRANGGRLPEGVAIPTHTWKKRESWQGGGRAG